MTCARCLELEEQIAALKRDMGDSVERTELADVRKALGLSKNEAWLLLALYHASPRVMGFEAVLARMPASHKDDPLDREIGQVQAVAYRVRRRTSANTIETVRGTGYRITEAGRQVVLRVLEGEHA